VRSSERGFSLIEIVIAAALFAVVAFAAFATLRQALADARRLGARHLALGTLERLSAQLRAEARGATAIWVGASAGAGHDDCDQLDFATADAGGPKFWSYRRFPNHGASDAIPPDALQRVASTVPVAACALADPAETVLTGTSGFTVARFDPSVLAAHADPYLGQPDGAFAKAVPPDPRVPLGMRDADGNAISGGNTLTEVRLDTGDGSRAVELVPGVFPSGFTAALTYTCNARCQVGHDTGAPKTLTACDVSWSTDPARFPQPVQAYVYDATTGTYVLTTRGYDWAVLFRFRYYDQRPVPPGTGDELSRYVVSDTFDGGGTPAPAAPPFDSSAGLPDANAWYAALAPSLSPAMRAAFDAENAICTGVNAQRTGPGYYDNG
jgi:prepilin-type N-terminal cleavage/methylation domain-containing protein